ncbi:MAG: indole-3-glycerol phosphate synthase TrpC [Propionibacteriaceae bacterium]|jgi:indole-3-glycerol phosphate synthase|nr:indole-3-glycerol phosphate synthase TrpC [Propionibacteriaceae bacterium]
MAATILDQLAESSAQRTAAEKAALAPEPLREAALALAAADRPGSAPADRFEAALAAPGMSFICELKKASPSKGVIAADYPYVEIARAYEAAGAAAVSVLTEPSRFLGQAEHLRAAARAVSLPVLRKDFIVDPYQIDQARLWGASAVLLIAALLGDALPDYLAAARAAGVAALTEVHDEREAGLAVAAGARVIGVNHRDLRTFSVDLGLSARLRSLVPAGTVFVAESGVKTAADVSRLRSLGVDAVLVGETLMRAPDKKAALQALRGEA